MKNIKSKLLGLGTGIAVGIGALFPMKSDAQVSGNVEYIGSEKASNSYMRLNGFYGLPSKIKAYSFLEFYKEGKGYFGKTTLTKPLTKNISAKTQIVHINEPYTKEGFGLGVKATSRKKNASIGLDYYPVWISKDIEKIKNESVIGYFASLKLFKNVNLSSFGQINIAAKEGPTLNYGEISLDKTSKNWVVGYNPALQRREIGKVKPKIEHRFMIRRKF